MAFKKGDRVRLLPLGSEGSQTGLREDISQYLTGREVEILEVWTLQTGKPVFSFEEMVPLVSTMSPCRIIWSQEFAEPIASPPVDPYEGYHRTPDGFLTNPKNWEKWLL